MEERHVTTLTPTTRDVPRQHWGFIVFFKNELVFAVTGLADDRCCSLRPPKLQPEYVSSSFASCYGRFYELPPLELELFVFLGTASCVLRLGLPLLLLFDDKEEERGGGRLLIFKSRCRGRD